ncbi:AbiH family protein [Wenyingzhuangia marina]|uniref:Bacteriophage abortive infection AbiH n=1 Tax=Wenyingzhuangia marina TaxID=1195760 RepID=A0A1M5VLZ1_9FLAO|nr:AbiH family protein [Wenyingzhuangia marina]SHH76261.1 Bacteriophage abortive infection AbiH [Wenyingzhuangia marina]
MKNIFIIGNGFDLAHGYDTDYASFIRYLIDNDKLIEKINTREGERTVVRNPGASRATHNSTFTTNKNGLNVKYEMFIDNEFLKEIIFKTNIEKWCDIEVLYYELLKPSKNPKKLNNELSQVKNELEKYLCQFNKEQNVIAEFSSFFEKIGKGRDNLVLNFNYTNTFERLYKNKIDSIEVLNFHGQLNSKTNPIIFGYAPTEEETKVLINKNDNEYLKNIKRYYYKQTQNENKLNEFLEKSDKNIVNSEEINVFVLGHSCGVSDRKILNDIFTDKNVKNINIMYYKDYQGYFDTLVNIDRVIGKESNYGVIRNFELSLQAPQKNDVEDIKVNFNNKLNVLVKELPVEIKKTYPTFKINS